MQERLGCANLTWLPALEHVDKLTQRELEVFVLLADGPSNIEIAYELSVVERTVRAHIGQIMSKLKLRSRLKVCLAAVAYVNRTVANDNSRQRLRPDTMSPLVK